MGERQRGKIPVTECMLSRNQNGHSTRWRRLAWESLEKGSHWEKAQAPENQRKRLGEVGHQHKPRKNQERHWVD